MDWEKINTILGTCRKNIVDSVSVGKMPVPMGLLFYEGIGLSAIYRQDPVDTTEDLDSFLHRVRGHSLRQMKNEGGDTVSANAAGFLVFMDRDLWKERTGEEAPMCDRFAVAHVERLHSGVRTWILTIRGEECSEWVLWRSGIRTAFPPLIHDRLYKNSLGMRSAGTGGVC